MLCLVVILSETSGLIQLTLPSDVILCMTNKSRRFGQVAFPRSYWKKGNSFSWDCVSRLLRALGQKQGHLMLFPSTCPGLLVGSFDEKSLWNLI